MILSKNMKKADKKNKISTNLILIKINGAIT